MGKKKWLAVGMTIIVTTVVAAASTTPNPSSPEEGKPVVSTNNSLLTTNDPPPPYPSSLNPKSFFDDAYERAGGSLVAGASSAVVAHHLLVASDIAEAFEHIGSDDVRTVILVSPNHFSRGMSRAQVSEGSWSTAYGTVAADADAIEQLLAAIPFLTHEEDAYPYEHGIYNLMPFVARSFPNARVIPIILRDELSNEGARSLGTKLATLFPDATLVASVDMTHEQPADVTAKNDARVLAFLSGTCEPPACDGSLGVDSTASLRILSAWNAARDTTDFHLTHHGSSLEMGAAKDWRENVSHVIGYFLKE